MPLNAQDVEETLEVYAAHLFNWMQRWQREGFQPIRQAWLEKAADLDSVINVDLGERRLTGIFKGLNSHGALELETENGVRTIGAGDVYFLPVKGLGIDVAGDRLWKYKHRFCRFLGKWRADGRMALGYGE